MKHYGKIWKELKKSSPLFSLLLPSFAVLFISALCFAGGTYAWFHASVSSSKQTLQAAQIGAEVSVYQAQNASGIMMLAEQPSEEPTWVELFPEEKGYCLIPGERYRVVMTPEGTAASGFGVFSFSGDDGFRVYQTETLASGTQYWFTISVDQPGYMEVSAQWGMPGAEEDELLEQGERYVFSPPMDSSLLQLLSASSVPESSTETSEMTAEVTSEEEMSTETTGEQETSTETTEVSTEVTTEQETSTETTEETSEVTAEATIEQETSTETMEETSEVTAEATTEQETSTEPTEVPAETEEAARSNEDLIEEENQQDHN